MNVLCLKQDEFDIEWELRDIASDSENAKENLQHRITEEASGNCEKPGKMHNKAAKRPDLEISSCRTKLHALQKEISLLADQDPSQQLKSAREIESRLMHVAARLQRATSSSTYASEAKRILQSCKILSESLQLYFNDYDKLNDSLEAAKAVDIEIPNKSEAELDATQSKVAADQMNVISCMMDQIRMLSQQVAELKKQTEISVQKPQDNHPPPSSVTFRNLSQNQIYPSNPHLGLPGFGYQSQPPISGTNVNFPQMVAPTDVSAFSRNQLLPNSLHNTSLKPREAHFHNQGTLPMNNHNPSMSQGNPTSRTFTPTEPLPYLTNHGLPISSPNRYVSEHRGLSRSGLSFDGSPTGIPISLFLFQLETLAASMNLDNNTLLTEISFVLKGIASHWYWTFRQQNPMTNWDDLRREMIERFKNRRPDSDIENKIECRKQLPNGSFLDFYQHIWSLTVQLSVPYPDQQLMKVLRKNMRPGLRYQLTDRQFSNISDLISSCTSWENT